MKNKKSYPYRHRDINWLSFNDRVLQEAADQSNPLYERLKFIAIFSSNLDEFFRVRISQLRQLKRVKKSIRKKLALEPSTFIKELLHKVHEQQNYLGDIFFDSLVPELKENGIHLLSYETLITDHADASQSIYTKEIETYVSKKLVSASKSSDIFLENQQLYFLVTFKNEESYGVVSIPSQDCDRFTAIKNDTNGYYFAFLDDLVKSNLDKIFPDKEITASYAIKLSRDAELYLDQELDGDLADQIYDSLSQRLDGQPTRLLYDEQLPKKVHKNLRKSLGLGKVDMVSGGRYHNFDDFFAFPDPTKNADLHAAPLVPIIHNALGDANRSYFDVISEQDQLVHFPYMSFDYVQNFINQAAVDPDVVEIKISLYRVASESALTDSLMHALEQGKKVTVFIEAKARFDEENNIKWGRVFEECGARVIYSYPKIKVHSKVLLVLRQEGDKLRRYAYIGTGNFNAKTSKVYCDHGLFTAHKKITKDLLRVFKVLQGELIIPRASDLLISPFSTRRTFEHLIHNEMKGAQQGKQARITAKMNQLEDKEMINLLYEASQAGVNIRLIIRGFCCLVPQLKGISDNIQVTSIVDQYLEHGRIYKFHNAGDPVMYMGSADWMQRNLDRRIEVLTPIYDRDLFDELDAILNLQLQDNVKARWQVPAENNPFVKAEADDPEIRSQKSIYDYLKSKHGN